jgi:cytochrome c peroxidase
MRNLHLATLRNFSVLAVLAFLATASWTSCCKPEPVPPPTALEVDVPFWIGTSIIGDMPHPANNPLTVEGVALGRKLFYDKNLSGDNTMSCASCHLQGVGFSDSAQFSTGIAGDMGGRQAMAVINLAWDDKLFWDGRAASLEDQAFLPVVNNVELNTTWPEVEEKLRADEGYADLFEAAFASRDIDSVKVVQAIAQFERTLVSFNSRYDRFFFGGEQILSDAELAGFDLFMGDAECVHCHAGPLMSDPTFRNNGLDMVHADLGLADVTGDPADNGKFKVTTLRNIGATAPYMHDGRFATLAEVIEHYNSGVLSDSPNIDPEMEHFTLDGGLNLTDEQKANLVAFLHTLTDEAFLTNSAFSDPN